HLARASGGFRAPAVPADAGQRGLLGAGPRAAEGCSRCSVRRTGRTVSAGGSAFLPLPDGDHLVHAAAAEPADVQRDVCVAELAQPGVDLRADLRLQRADDLVGRQLDARQVVVVTHAALAEAQRLEQRFGTLDLLEFGRRDLFAVLHAA